LVVAAAHAPTQLVQLREAKLVGAAHDDGVGRGHVDAGLDDGRAQQDVEALGHKVAHHALQLALGHLAVGHGDAGFGQDLFELLAPVLDGLDLVVQEVALAAALQFTQHGLADHACALVAHKGLDRQAPLRCGGDDRQVAQPFQRMPSVRGMGVAVSVTTSTSARNCFICSLWRTPKRCSRR
jgi:hypothetical protein